MNTVTKLAPWILGVAAIEFAAGVVTSASPDSVGVWIVFVCALAVSLGVAVYLATRPRPWSFLTAPLVLWMAVVALLVGNYAAYRLGLWGLDYDDYGTDDQPGAKRLGFMLFGLSWVAIVVGIVIGFAANIVMGVLRRFSLGSPANARR